jgi:hypothetical protein
VKERKTDEGLDLRGGRWSEQFDDDDDDDEREKGRTMFVSGSCSRIFW